MEQKPNLDMVFLAVSSLYNNPDSTEKERASQWLGDLQKSVHAWTIADELLRHKRDLESCYFAAQTMRTKIHQSFHELPLDAHLSLRDSLLDHIGQITEGTNSVIITQLCLALADLALQMPSWQKASLDLIRRYNQSHLWPLLEILTVLPEELESRSVRLGENRRQEILEDFKACSQTVNEFLQHCCNSYTTNIHENIQINTKIIKCFTSWISLGAISLSDVLNNLVVAKAFAILSYKQETDKFPAIPATLHDISTDCIGALLQSLEDNNNQQSLESYLFNSVLSLEIPYHLSVANEDPEKCMNYCRIFTELGETFLEKIIAQSKEEEHHYALKVLDLVLICVGHHDYEVAEITFNLWYVLSEELYQKNSKGVTEMFRPYVERLLAALCRHCQMEPDCEGLLQDGDDFKDFRGKVSDLVKDVVFIVGSSSCFKHMFLNLQTPSATWDSSEASLFIMKAVAKNVLPTENEVVPQVLEAILHLSPTTTHLAVRHTATLLLGELCEWVEKHPTTVLDPVLNCLVRGLGEGGGVSAAAAVALQQVCATCSDHMPHHVPVLLQLVRQVDTFAITSGAVIGLLKGISAIIGCMNNAEMTPALGDLCSLQTTPLAQLISQDVIPVRGTKSDPILWLDRLAAIFRYIVCAKSDGPNPILPVVLDSYPTISLSLTTYQADARITERCTRCLRFMLRSVSQQLRDHLLEPLVRQIVTIYARHPHSCFLYLGSILVDEYATDTQCVTGLLEMLQEMLEPTFGRLMQVDGLRGNPDTVDDFFRLCARFIQRTPVAFLQSTALKHIIECGLLACSLDHKEANTSVMKFFYDVVNTGRRHGSSRHQTAGAGDATERQLRHDLVTRILAEYGAQLVASLVQASVFHLHTYMLSEVGDIFEELLTFDRDSTGRWLGEALATLPERSGSVVVTVTPQQLNDFHVSVMRAEDSKSVTYALKDLSRLYR